VDSPEEVDRLVFPAEAKIAYLTQTTLSIDEAGRVIERLKERFPHIESPPKEDICYATTNRQEAVRVLAEQADLLIVLGSQNSSNSRRLMELGESSGTPAHLIDDVRELKDEWFEECETVLITAGASAPEVVVQECVDHLIAKFGATVREEKIREEHVYFPLPKELRALQANASR
jgi:4-hydroxy-3-methylbut-2-enyl diphosphate reductase